MKELLIQNLEDMLEMCEREDSKGRRATVFFIITQNNCRLL